MLLARWPSPPDSRFAASAAATSSETRTASGSSSGLARFAADGARRTAAVLLLTLAVFAGIPQQAAAQPCPGDTAPAGAVWTACLTVGLGGGGDVGYILGGPVGALAPATFTVDGDSYTVADITTNNPGLYLHFVGNVKAPPRAGRFHAGPDTFYLAGAFGNIAYFWQTGAPSWSVGQKVTVALVETLPRVAAAAAPSTVDPGGSARLTATARDPDGGSIVSYAWSQTSGPAGRFDRTDGATATWTAPKPVEVENPNVEIQVVVTDDDGETATGAVTIAVSNPTYSVRYSGQQHAGQWMYYTRDSRTRGQPTISVSTLAGVPILVCGHDGAINGSGLYCGDGVNHEWASVDASLSGSGGGTDPEPPPPPPPPPDPDPEPEPDPEPPPPVSNFPTADAGPDQIGVWEGALVMLDGSGSSHPEDDQLKYRWNQLSGQPVVLSSQNIVNPIFTAPQGLTADAVLNFSLLVTDPSGRFDSDTVTVTVDPEAEPPLAIYYFPHLAVGAGWQTTITYINYSPEVVSCRTEFLSDQGTPLLVSFADRGMVPNRNDVLQPGESVHEETNVALSALRVAGWARTACTGPVKASLLYRRYNSEGIPTGEAGVNATTVPATRFVTFAEQGEGQHGTGVAYANPSDTQADITFTVRDADGETLASANRSLSPGGHDAQNMQPLFGLTSFSGSLEVTSTQPIVSLSLNNEADPVFSSLPPGELDAASQGTQQMTTYYFPHLAVGAGWQTTLTYINYSSEEVSCQTEFLSDHGGPLLISFAGLGTVVSRPDVLPPGGSLHEETNVALSAPLSPGWARATCSGPLKASLLYRRFEEGVPTGEAAVNATTVPATRFVTFAEQGEGKFGTGVAYANPSATTTAFVTFTVRDADEDTLASVVRTLLPNGHDAQNMVDLFDLGSFSGSLEITSTEPIVSLSLNNEAAPVFSSLPPGEVDDAAQ